MTAPCHAILAILAILVALAADPAWAGAKKGPVADPPTTAVRANTLRQMATGLKVRLAEVLPDESSGKTLGAAVGHLDDVDAALARIGEAEVRRPKGKPGGRRRHARLAVAGLQLDQAEEAMTALLKRVAASEIDAVSSGRTALPLGGDDDVERMADRLVQQRMVIEGNAGTTDAHELLRRLGRAPGRDLWSRLPGTRFITFELPDDPEVVIQLGDGSRLRYERGAEDAISVDQRDGPLDGWRATRRRFSVLDLGGGARVGLTRLEGDVVALRGQGLEPIGRGYHKILALAGKPIATDSAADIVAFRASEPLTEAEAEGRTDVGHLLDPETGDVVATYPVLARDYIPTEDEVTSVVRAFLGPKNKVRVRSITLTEAGAIELNLFLGGVFDQEDEEYLSDGWASAGLVVKQDGRFELVPDARLSKIRDGGDRFSWPAGGQGAWWSKARIIRPASERTTNEDP